MSDYYGSRGDVALPPAWVVLVFAIIFFFGAYVSYQFQKQIVKDAIKETRSNQ